MKGITPEGEVFISIYIEDENKERNCDTSATETETEDELESFPEPSILLFDAISINCSVEEFAVLNLTPKLNVLIMIIIIALMKLSLSLSNHRYLLRSGRITVSNFHEECHLEGKSKSLIGKIMAYTKVFSTTADHCLKYMRIRVFTDQYSPI